MTNVLNQKLPYPWDISRRNDKIVGYLQMTENKTSQTCLHSISVKEEVHVQEKFCRSQMKNWTRQIIPVIKCTQVFVFQGSIFTFKQRGLSMKHDLWTIFSGKIKSKIVTSIWHIPLHKMYSVCSTITNALSTVMYLKFF